MKNINIHWLIPFSKIEFEEIKNSTIASIRLRAAVVADFFFKIGLKLTFGEKVEDEANTLLIGKIGTSEIKERSDNWLKIISHAKKKGAKIILDYTDHHLGFDSPMKEFYRSVLTYIDQATVSSNYLGQMLKNFFSGNIEVIPDPIEIPIYIEKKQFNNNYRSVLWFGHSSNILYLVKLINNLDTFKIPIELRILSNEQSLLVLQKINTKRLNNIKIKFDFWSVDKMILTAKDCDICIIPSDINEVKKMGVSSNRLLTALALGLPTAADMLPSYKIFNEYFTDIRSSGFNELMLNPSKFTKHVKKAQKNILPLYNFENIGKIWHKFLKNIT